MPFDQSTYQPEVKDEVLDTLVKAREWLSDPAHWHKGSHGVRGLDGKYAATCAWGALGLVLGQAQMKVPMHIQEYLHSQVPGRRFASVMQFNDHPDTTHADILGVFDRAIAARKAEAR